jgi:hypothetical protein
MPDVNELKKRLHKLFEQHIAENKGQPLFASDIKDEKKREDWKKNQLEQWEARHEILEKLVEVKERANKEISIADFLTHPENSILLALSRFEPAHNLELRQRWLKPAGERYLNWAISYRAAQYYNRVSPTSPLTKSMVTQRPDLPYAREVEVQNKDFRLADLFKKILIGEKLPNSYLHANLKEAQLEYANLKESNLAEAELQGANFNGAVIAGPVLRRVDTETSNAGTGQAIQEIDDRSANFYGVEFTREWRGPKWTTPIAWALHLGNKKLAWHKSETTEEKKTEKNWIIRLLKFIKRKWKEFWASRRWYLWIKRKWNEFLESPRWYSGRPTTFHGVDTSRMDGSKNPGLKRYIEDEQYIEDFKEKHRVIYWLWAMSSDCGRCLSLWAFWSIVIAGIFGFLYAGYDWMPQDGQPELTIDYTAETTVRDPVTGLKEPLREKTWFTPYYYSIVTFTTLGFGDIKPRNLAAEIWLTLEVVCGYVFLGGLVAILASKLARRA